MAEEIEISKGRKKTQSNFDDEESDDDTKAFTVDEMNAIIDAFEASNHRKHLAPIIKFCFALVAERLRRRGLNGAMLNGIEN